MKVLLVALLVYVLIGGYLFFEQKRFIYFPTPPSLTHLHKEEAYFFDDAVVKVVSVNQEKSQAILYFGGNAEAVEHNAGVFKVRFPNYASYFVKYRGYGGSTGTPSEENLYSDALAIFDDLARKYTDVSVIGRSLGSGIATFVASQRAVRNLVLITPFDAIESVAQSVFPFFPMPFLLTEKYPSIDHVPLIDANTLIVIAGQDQVISKKHSDRLVEAFYQRQNEAQVSVVVIPDAGHNDLSEFPLYDKTLVAFLKTKQK